MLYLVITNNKKKYYIVTEATRYYFEVRGYKVEAIGHKKFMKECKSILENS